MKKSVIHSLIFVLVFSVTPTAFAANINAGVGTSASVNADSDITVDADVSVGATTSSEGGSASSSDETSTVLESDTEGNVEGSGIRITRTSAQSNTGAEITSATSVQNGSDLSAYASTMVKGDENIETAELSGNSVSLRYKQRAKLFGFIPVFVYTTAKVEQNGSISIEYPWYGVFLSQDTRATLESNLQTAIQSNVGGQISAESNTGLSSETQAEILETLRTTMKQNLEASLAAEAATSANNE